MWLWPPTPHCAYVKSEDNHISATFLCLLCYVTSWTWPLALHVFIEFVFGLCFKICSEQKIIHFVSHFLAPYTSPPLTLFTHRNTPLNIRLIWPFDFRILPKKKWYSLSDLDALPLKDRASDPVHHLHLQFQPTNLIAVPLMYWLCFVPFVGKKD